MAEASITDQTEKQINSFQQALLTLAELPADHAQLKNWLNWSNEVFKGINWHHHLTEVMTIAYARMALRNGLLSPRPRSYHNEKHINDLLTRIIYCAEQYKHQLNPNGLALLSVFAATHDLRQDEPRNPDQAASLVGANEQASYLEAARIIKLCGPSDLWHEHHLLLLRTMIEGSTFGSGGKKSKNFFQGNLSKHLLSQLQLPNKNDEQLVLLACDIDTANVSMDIDEFALSAVHIYDELVSHQQAQLSAQQFFSKQQMIYFFEQQQFNANISLELFAPQKHNNQKKLKTVATYISHLDPALSAAEIKTIFLKKAQELASQ